MGIASITIDCPESAADIAALIQPSDPLNTNLFINSLQNYLNAIAGGARVAGLTVETNKAQATGTLTLVSVVATNTAAINGVTFTAIASGATGNQFNVGADDTATAANLAATINASVTALVAGYVTATSALGVVTVTSVGSGKGANTITITGGTNITASGARLTGGSSGTSVTYHMHR